MSVTHVGFTSAVIVPRGTVPLEQDAEHAEYKFRPYEGVGNNFRRPRWGAAGAQLLRTSVAAYDPGTQLSLPGNPNPRVVSNAVCKGTPVPSARLTNLVWPWAQFVDHQLDLTVPQDGGTAEVITIPLLDTDPNEDHYYPGRAISVTRSQFRVVGGVRQHANQLTAYVDASNVYGTTPDMCARLRALDGTGKLKTSMADNGEELLPYNTVGLTMDVFGPADQESLFAAGDARANENIALIAMHTIWVREHNRLCNELVRTHPEWAGQDEMLFQHARRRVVGTQQHILFDEMLPALLGPLPTYSGHDDGVDPGVATEFSTVGFRVGHTMLPDVLQTSANPADTLSLFDAFFRPSWVQAHGIDALLVGLSVTKQQRVDNVVVDSVRNQLFGPPTTTAMRDLAAINIQRGRDHGIPGYNAVRVAYGLGAVTWDTMPTTPALRATLAGLYAGPDVLDAWVGCICETHLPGAEVGPLLRAIIWDQARRARAGDRFWYQNDPALSVAERNEIAGTTLGDVLNRNTAPGFTFPRNVFVAP
jgi:peroxidase